MFTRLLKSEALQTASARLIGFYLDAALRSIRWTVEGADNLAPFLEQRPVIVAFWHESLPLIPALWRRVLHRNPARRATILVSRHRDGRFIAAALTRFTVDTVHGSTAKPGKNKGGAAGLRALLTVLAAEHMVAITPDGPGGPRRQAAGGAAQLAALSGAPILPIWAQCHVCLRLPSWDRMMLPLPFGRGRFSILPPIIVAREGAEAATAALQSALNQAAGVALP
jgi:lysophospholipid acyltransferase (LPLAT)-like uncharacterized protein